MLLDLILQLFPKALDESRVVEDPIAICQSQQIKAKVSSGGYAAMIWRHVFDRFGHFPGDFSACGDSR